jgi:hypothetical protein
MSAVNEGAMRQATLTCPQCSTPFQPAPTRGKPQKWCSRPCQIKAANARRKTTRAGRSGTTIETNPQVLSPTLAALPPTVDRSTSDAPGARLSELMEKAHSRGGVTAWEIAELAKLRGISPWAPLAKIIAP